MTYFTKDSSSPLIFQNSVGSAGEATIYPIQNSNLVAKIFHDTISKDSVKYKIISRECFDLSEDLLEYATLPRKIIVNEKGEIVGYAMPHLKGWHNFEEILNYNLKTRVWAFCHLHKALHIIHKHGFVIGDFSTDNIMFKIDGKNMKVCFIDTDSWSHPNDNLQAKIIKATQAQHPELYLAIIKNDDLPPIQPKHDWWSFTYLLYIYLTGGCDPFDGIGNNIDYDERVIDALVIQLPDVKIDLELSQNIYSLGPVLLHVCNRILTTKDEHVFPIQALIRLYGYTIPCRNCKKEVNHEIGICPFCSGSLKELYL